MAFQEISTGYKPEFTLGGLYHGFNAANAEDLSQEELLKQFLLNQREQSMQPLEIEQAELKNQGTVFDNMVKDLQGRQAQAQNNPESLGLFGMGKDATNRDLIRKDEIGQLLQPFIKQQVPLEQGAKTTTLDLQNQVAQIDKLIANGGTDQYGVKATPQQLGAWQQERERLVQGLASTPELAGKTALEHVKGQWDLDRTKYASDRSYDAAQYRADHPVGGSGGAKTLAIWQRDLAGLESSLRKQREAVSDARQNAGISKSKGTQEALAIEEQKLQQLETELNRNRNAFNEALRGGTVAPDTPQQPQPTAKVIKYDSKGNRIE